MLDTVATQRDNSFGFLVLDDAVVAIYLQPKTLSKTAYSTAGINKSSSRCQLYDWRACRRPQTATYERSKAFNCCCLAVIMLSLTTFFSSALAAPTATTTTTTTLETLSDNSNSIASTPVVVVQGPQKAHLQNKSLLFVKFVESLRMQQHQRRYYKRHSKRHSNWYEDYTENSTIIEWQNPCGGVFDETPIHSKRKNPKQFFKILKQSVANAWQDINSTRHSIREKDVGMWALHNSTYKFLPKLKANSKIALKRWHRNMQTYVASFAYLRREQLKWDHRKSQRESLVAQELKMLLTTSRVILCELETAVNGTQPRRNRRLYQFSRSEMNRRLKLRTKRNVAFAAGQAQEADVIDLVFVKYYYLDFLQKMRGVLREKTKRRGQIALAINHKDYNEVEKRRSPESMSIGIASSRLLQSNAVANVRSIDTADVVVAVTEEPKRRKLHRKHTPALVAPLHRLNRNNYSNKQRRRQ